MVDIITREGKGSPLTHAELDGNFTNLKAAIEDGTDYYASVVLADTPVVYWRMGDADGTAIKDSSGNGYNISLGSTVRVRCPGALNGSGDNGAFFPESSSVAFPSALTAAFPLTANLTFECWWKASSISKSYSPIIGVGLTSGTNQQAFRLCSSWDSSGVFLPTLMVGSNDANANGHASAAGAMPLNDWCHIVGTYDGTTIKLYVNGVLSGSTSYATSIPAMARGLSYIGQSTYGDTINAGILDEVALYNACLSADQVAAHYRVARGGVA